MGLGDAVKYLYSQFILRDVLSFITPGAIVFLTAFLIILPETCLSQRVDTLFEYSRKVHWLLYILLFGVFYIVGFSIQCFGEIIGFIRIHRIAQSCFSQRFKIFGCNWACKRDKEGKSGKCDEPDFIWWKEAYKETVKLHIATKEIATKEQEDKREWAQQQDERSTVLMQMCGNSVLGIVIVAIPLLVNHWFYLASLVLFFIMALLLLTSLFWGYRVHVLRQDTLTKEIRYQLENIKQKKEPTTKES